MFEKIKNRSIIHVILLISLHSVIFAQERTGSTSAQFLKIGVSAKAEGMGGAYISLAEGAEAVFYNPSAIARIFGTSIAFTHNRWFAGISHDFFAIAHSFDYIGSFGLSITTFRTDEMLVTTPLQPNGTGETFYAGDYRVGLTYARSMTDRVEFGGTVNYIYSNLYRSYGVNAVSIDISTLYAIGFRNFRFGMKISNFGTSMTYISESYPLPVSFTFGLSMNVLEFTDQILVGSISVAKPNEGKPLGKFGFQWNSNETLFLRAGGSLGHDVRTFAFGGGVIVGMLSIDYSYSDFSLLGASHRVTLGISMF